MKLVTQVERSADHTVLVYQPKTDALMNPSLKGIVELALAKNASEPTKLLTLKWNATYGIYEDEEGG